MSKNLQDLIIGNDKEAKLSLQGLRLETGNGEEKIVFDFFKNGTIVSRAVIKVSDYNKCKLSKKIDKELITYLFEEPLRSYYKENKEEYSRDLNYLRELKGKYYGDLFKLHDKTPVRMIIVKINSRHKDPDFGWDYIKNLEPTPTPEYKREPVKKATKQPKKNDNGAYEYYDEELYDEVVNNSSYSSPTFNSYVNSDSTNYTDGYDDPETARCPLYASKSCNTCKCENCSARTEDYDFYEDNWWWL